MKRILSVLLVAVMLFGALAGLLPGTAVKVQAEEIETGNVSYDRVAADAMEQTYASLKDKLFGVNKDPYLQNVLTVNVSGGDTYQLYCNPYTGEVIYYNATEENGISTNPYDFGNPDDGNEISDVVKEQLLSQVVVSYKGKDGNLKYMYSFTEAAKRGQIQVKTIKNGIRVQYSIGRENANYLMPGWITKEAFEKKIVAPLDKRKEELSAAYDGQLRYTSGSQKGDYTPYGIFVEEVYNKIVPDGVTYTLQDPNKPGAVKETMFKKYPITAKINDETGTNYAIYVVSEGLAPAQKSRIEALIKTYCPNYTYEDVLEDNEITGYESKAETPPFFKLALEYTINPATGALDIRLPSNGILYDETLFELEYISTLNYLGAGKMDTVTYGDYASQNGIAYGGDAKEEMLYDGYVFYPDGSGALFEYSDLYTDTKKTSIAWSGKVYGQDYAYYTVSGQHQEAVRLPVYGVINTDDVAEVPMLGADNNQLVDDNGKKLYDLVPVRSGFLAILEEGDALTSLSVSFGAARHNYASVYPTYYPRPKDTYDLADSVSVSGNTEWTVVADRKYTGSYRTRIELLSSNEANWVGMATKYREYLKGNGTLTPLANTASQIPLYLEAFGAIETTKQILSFPVTVNVPLTTFDNVGEIYDDLKNSGITNVNFKLTGFANGGMNANYPAKIKWEKAVGGKRGFRELIEKAETEGFGVYPEFDFLYLSHESSGDGVSLKKIGARTVDNRYCSKQIYDAVYQQFTSFFDMCVATNLIGGYYEKLATKLSKFDEGTFGLSLSTLGSDLNSNFDEDNPINREQAKQDIEQLLANVTKSYSVMLSGGNRYAINYADHILEMPLDSSNYRYASASVPFMAMVLHGYVNYAGNALNMSGDSEYNLLKSIENGAYPYYLLSYNTENAMLLKKDESLSKYYSIRYDIWRWKDSDAKTGDGTVIEQYRTLNAALADLQTAEMVDHKFIRGERNLKDYETAANKKALHDAVLAAVKAEIAARETDLFNLMKTERDIYLSAKKNDEDFCSFIESYVIGGYDVTIDPTATKWAKEFEGIDPTDTAAIAAKKAEIEERETLAAVLADFANALYADGVAKSYAEKVFDAYYNGDGLAELGVRLGLTVKVNADVDAIIAKADAFIGDALTDGEKAALWADVRTLIAANTDTGAGETILEELKVILGDVPTDEDAALFNKLVYAGFGDAKIAALATGFSKTVADTDALAALVKLCRDTRGFIMALVNDVTVDYDFNKTNSEATDGTNYVDTDYTLKDERLVMVTYEKQDGTLVRFVLNYNLFDVTVRIDGEPYVIPSYSFWRDPATIS